MRSKTITLLALTALALPACSISHESPDGHALLHGWTEQKFAYEIQHPYDLDVNERYSYDPQTDTHDLWVNFTDKPHNPPPNKTNPRTELRLLDTYATVPHAFEADVCVKPGTHASIMQVFGAAKRATTFMLDAQENGDLTYYDTADPYAVVLKPHMNNVWFNLKVFHDPAARNAMGEIKIYIDNHLAGTFEGHGGAKHYFKCGVYSRDNSGKSEVLFRHIREFARQ